MEVIESKTVPLSSKILILEMTSNVNFCMRVNQARHIYCTFKQYLQVVAFFKDFHRIHGS